MLLERQQQGKVKDVFDLRSSNGQVGEGVYFHLYGHPAMKNITNKMVNNLALSKLIINMYLI